MYRITISEKFCASHCLSIAGKRERLHSHNWLAEVAVEGEKLDVDGLLFDFDRLKKIICDITSAFEGCNLEELPAFSGRGATAENVAGYIYGAIKSRLPGQIGLIFVEITETDGCRARYSE